MLPKWDQPPISARLRNCSIPDFQLIETLGNGGLGAPNLKITTVDKVLHSDIGAHFIELSVHLATLERMTRRDGMRVIELLFRVSKAVYLAMASSDLSILRYTFDQGKRAILREIPVGIEAQGYAGWLFLLLIGEDPLNWPVDHSNLKRYDLLEGLEILAGQIRSQTGHEVTEMLKLRERLFSRIERCIALIEEQRHKMAMKGKCEYL